MEFNFKIHDILRKPISIFSGTELPRKQQGFERLAEVIDDMGIASAKAQGLRAPITSAIKLKHNEDQRLYIMREIQQSEDQTQDKNDLHDEYETEKFDRTQRMNERRLRKFHQYDQEFKYGAGGLTGYESMSGNETYVVVGILKVGTKKLFLNDEYGRHIEVSPLCVLDFYIHETYRRRGYGKRLFDFMLAMELKSPWELCYDRPSDKFISFLSKHYQLNNKIPQVNNFLVFKEFGLGMLDIDSKGVPKYSDNLRGTDLAKFTMESKYRKKNANLRRPEGLTKTYTNFTKDAKNELQKLLPQHDAEMDAVNLKVTLESVEDFEKKLALDDLDYLIDDYTSKNQDAQSRAMSFVSDKSQLDVTERGSHSSYNSKLPSHNPSVANIHNPEESAYISSHQNNDPYSGTGMAPEAGTSYPPDSSSIADGPVIIEDKTHSQESEEISARIRAVSRFADKAAPNDYLLRKEAERKARVRKLLHDNDQPQASIQPSQPKQVTNNHFLPSINNNNHHGHNLHGAVVRHHDRSKKPNPYHELNDRIAREFGQRTAAKILGKNYEFHGSTVPTSTNGVHSVSTHSKLDPHASIQGMFAPLGGV